MPWVVDSSGTQSATVGTEHVLAAPATTGTYVLDVDTAALALGDLLELRIYDAVSFTLRLAWKGTFQNGQINNDKQSPPIAVTTGAQFTLRQIAGTARSFPWSIKRQHSGSAIYSGPGNLVGGAYAWYGLRGYAGFYANGPSIDIVDQAGNNPLTVKILSSGGLDTASVSAWVTANSVTTIKVKKLYDQSGNGRDAVQATLSQMPVLNLTGFGAKPAIVFTHANNHSMRAAVSVTYPQPITLSVVYLRSTDGDLLGHGTSPYTSASNGLYYIVAGNAVSATAANGVWHAAQGIFNGASSAIYVDGTGTTGLNAGTAAPSSVGITIGEAIGYQTFDGSFVEAGFWPLGFNATQAGNLNSNQHTYWGF